LRSLIDLIEAVKLCQVFERKVSLRVEFDELWDKNVDRFGVLDERGIADKGGGDEEAQHLPEGYIPRLNGEDGPTDS